MDNEMQIMAKGSDDKYILLTWWMPLRNPLPC